MNDLTREYLTTRELAELLRIKERKVYDLAASNTIPCTRATGKLLFSRAAVEAWLSDNRSDNSKAGGPVTARPNVMLGSHDPLLDWSLKASGCGLASYFDGSMDGIHRFQNREGVAAALHLFDTRHEEWNVPTVKDLCCDMDVVLLEFTRRQRGLISRPETDPAVNGINNLRGPTIAPRQAGAGSQALLLGLLNQHGIAEAECTFSSECQTESEAVISVFEGKADVTLGLSGLAQQYRLRFVPVIEERFDLLVDRHSYFEPPMQTFLNFCHSSQFAKRASEFSGYDFSNCGSVVFNA